MGVLEMSKLFSDFQMSCRTVFKCPVDKILECTLLHQKDILQNLVEDSFSKVFGGKYFPEKFPEGFFGKQLQIFLEGFFFGKQSQIFLEGFFLKQLQIFPEGLFCKTTSNLP